MRLVERIRSELLPVAPDFLQNLRVVSVLLSTLDELGLHVVQLVAQLLSHRLTQGVTLTTGEVRQQTGEQHDLLLIDRDAVGVLQILLHDGDVVFDGLASVFAVDEVGDVVHRSRTVKGVHGDEVLERGRLELAQVLLHARRLELERTDGASLAVQFIGGGIVDVDGVDVYLQSQTQADVLDGLLDDGECLQSEEVHLDQSGVFDDRAFVLCHQYFLSGVLVVGRTDGYPVGDVVTADDGAAGMHAGIADVAFQHPGILDGVAQDGVGRCLRLLQLRDIFDGIRQVDLLVGYLVGDELAEVVRGG